MPSHSYCNDLAMFELTSHKSGMFEMPLFLVGNALILV